MKVTVQSPYTAEVTIAQAEAWLERNGWKRIGGYSASCDTWSNNSISDLWLVYVPRQDATSHFNCQPYMAELIDELAQSTERLPADILREISEVVL